MPSCRPLARVSSCVIPPALGRVHTGSAATLPHGGTPSRSLHIRCAPCDGDPAARAVAGPRAWWIFSALSRGCRASGGPGGRFGAPGSPLPGDASPQLLWPGDAPAAPLGGRGPYQSRAPRQGRVAPLHCAALPVTGPPAGLVSPGPHRAELVAPPRWPDGSRAAAGSRLGAAPQARGTVCVRRAAAKRAGS
jgi:hypothetical protein